MTNYQSKIEEKESLLWEQYHGLANKELIALLDDTDGMKSRIAASQLQLRGGDDIFKLAISFCLGHSYQRRMESSFILGQIKLTDNQQKEAIQLLNKLALQDKSALVRANAITAMGHRCRINDIFSSIVLKQSQLTVMDKSSGVRQATAFALSCIQDKQAIPLLLKLLKDANNEVRNWAAFAVNVNEYDTPEIRDYFVELLSDQYSEVRVEAINGLAHRQDIRVVKVLANELKRKIVYHDFVESAGELGDITLLPILQDIATRVDDFEELRLAIQKLQEIKGFI